MVANLLDEGLPCAFVLADAVYGTDIRFRRMLENRAQPYILAVKSNHTLRSLEECGLVQTNPKIMVSERLPEAWVSLSAGEATKGHRLYDWARIQLGRENENGFSRWLVARRSPRVLIVTEN